MEPKIDEKVLQVKYSNFTNNEIEKEFKEIISIPNARTNINALTRLSVLLPIMEKRGLRRPTAQSQSAHHSQDSSVSWGGVVLGLVLTIGGIMLSAGSGTIFYGAVIVGISILFRSIV